MPASRSEPSVRQAVATNLVAVVAAFSVYFCMYAFRKPFTAGTFEGQEVFGLGLKTVLVLSQLCGYMVSKFIGIKFVSELPAHRRALALFILVGIAELALVGFAFLPTSFKIIMLFLNGLPLGMVFGIVLSYLEGRRHTEALAAGLCASFIISSGVVKSVGRWLVEQHGISEFHMPYLTGAIFLLPLIGFVLLLHQTPAPTQRDRELRSERRPMDRRQRQQFFRAYAPGLSLLLFAYIALTIIRTMRDDFGVEIWRGLGVSERPAVFAQSETLVAIVATAVNALAICFVRNLTALRAATILMCCGFAMTLFATWSQWQSGMEPFTFMVLCGIGLYIPYVAFHTTVFERIVAASKQHGNLPFLMYLADSVGYLGYAFVVAIKTFGPEQSDLLGAFRQTLLWGSAASLAAICLALWYFQRTFTPSESATADGARAT